MGNKNLLLISLVGLVMGCSSVTDEPTPVEITEPRIKEVVVDPAIVSAGDTIKFTVLMEDGFVPNMQYLWTILLPNGRILDDSLSTDTEFSLVIDSSPGDYTGFIVANDTTVSGTMDSEDFSFRVDQ